jgi:hypothetical protein
MAKGVHTGVITREKRVIQYFEPPETEPSSRGVLGAQRLLQIGDQIFLVFDADRQPHHVGRGT